ncbi:zf-CCHC domain-containing protein [Tanacetum coccineum]
MYTSSSPPLFRDSSSPAMYQSQTFSPIAPSCVVDVEDLDLFLFLNIILRLKFRVETDIQEKDKKKAKNKQNRARNGKDKVKSKPKTAYSNIQVKDNKINLLVQQYEQFTIFEEESIDSGFARFNTIITSLKAFDEGFSSKNYVRKFFRALHPKWRAKVTTIEESKDLSSLALDELIGNLKVHELVMEKDSEIYKGKKERVKSIALKAKKESSDDETSTSKSDDEEYAMAVRNFKKFFRRKGKFVRQPREEKKSFQQRDDKKSKSDRKCFRCGDPNHLIGDCPKPPRNKDQKAFVGGCWSDSENEAEDKTNDETCLMAQSSNEVTLDSSHYSDNASSFDDDKKEILELNDKIKKLKRNKEIDIGCESCPQLRLENAKLKENQSKFVKFDKSANSLREMLNIQKSPSCKIGLGFDNSKASTNGTKPTSFVGSTVELAVKESLNVTFDESPPPTKLSPLVDDDVGEEEAIKNNIKVVNNNNIEDESIEVDDVINIKESKNHPLGQCLYLRINRLLEDENGIVSRNKARLVAQRYNQQEGIDYDETYAPVARLESIRILLAIASANEFKLYQMDVKIHQGDVKEVRVGRFQTNQNADVDGDQAHKDNEADSVDSTKYRGTKMPSEYQQDYQKTLSYALKIYNNPNMSEQLKDIYRALESRYVHEGRTIDHTFYQDLNDEYLAKFTNIGFDCLLSLDEQICLRFIMEFYKTLRLDRNLNENYLFIQFNINRLLFNLSLDQFAELTSLPNQGICLYSGAWSLDQLEKTLEQIPPYNSTLPSLEDIRNLIHRRTVFEKQTKQGLVQKLPNQIETNELFEHLKPCELVIRENVYAAIGNKDHVQASIALMLYCLETGRPYNLAYVIVMRMYYFRDRLLRFCHTA